MKMSEAFPSKYINAADLQGQPHNLVMGKCEYETMQDGKTIPVLYFEGKEKGLGLNKTNASVIVGVFGDESESWKGKVVQLYPTETTYQGKMVPCVRLRVVTGNAPAKPAQQAPPDPAASEADPAFDAGSPDDIPF